MKKYLNSKEFIEYLKTLKTNIPVKVYTESMEDNTIEGYPFMRINFSNNDIILYTLPDNCTAGIIQDTPVSSWEDYAELVYDDLTVNDEYKVFIKTN